MVGHLLLGDHLPKSDNAFPGYLLMGGQIPIEKLYHYFERLSNSKVLGLSLKCTGTSRAHFFTQESIV